MSTDDFEIDLSQQPIQKNPSQDRPDVSDLGVFGDWIRDENLRRSRFFGEYLTRLVEGRDMNVVITAGSETGVGKTTLAVQLALMLDPHGWTADKASVADPQDYDVRYDRAPPGSVLILDEAEKAMDARRGMSNDAVNLSQTFATKRYRQVFSILTAPSKNWIDKRLGSDAADFWIQCEQTHLGRVKGEAKCYRLKTNEHYEQDYAKRTEILEWDSLDDHPEFQKLNQRKEDLLESGKEQQYVDAEDVEDIKQETAEETRKRQRKEAMKRLDDIEGITQREIGKAFDVDAALANRIINDNE